MNYLIKYIEKSGERIVYYGDLPQYFVSDVMEDDIICPYGEYGRKFILADSFGCWDEGEYMGQVSKETIAKMPKDDVASALLVLLYFGLRQSELPTLKVIDGNTLECETSKERMGRNVTLRYIPFTPMFKKVQDLVDFGKAKNVNVYTLRSAFKRLLPEHHPHELRYTFITRCKECGVSGEVVMLWDGHSGDKDVKTSAVDRGYTDYSKEYILSEAEKVNYDL